MTLKTNQKTAEAMCFCITSAIIIVKLKKVTKKHHIMTRPPKVRPKKSNFGGRYFYVKIQL